MNPTENTPNASADPTGLFRSAWTTYDTVVQQNYMFHREIHATVRAMLAARSAQGPYRLLDLGCGNARLLADSLQIHPPARYLGVDLASPALGEAAVHLSGLPQVDLRELDLLICALQQPPQSFEVVYSGFAIHHLHSGDKQRLFNVIADVLTPCGEFVIVDVLREENQTREEYLEAYRRMIREDWRALEETQIIEIERHITTHDFPEPLSTLTEMAHNAGFRHAVSLGKFGAHQVVKFTSKPSALL